MITQKFNWSLLCVAVSASLTISVSAFAQENEETNNQEREGIEQIVVTGSVAGRSQIESAISVTSIDDEVLRNFKPNSEVEMFRLLPGIQANGNNVPEGMQKLQCVAYRLQLPVRLLYSYRRMVCLRSYLVIMTTGQDLVPLKFSSLTF